MAWAGVLIGLRECACLGMVLLVTGKVLASLYTPREWESLLLVVGCMDLAFLLLGTLTLGCTGLLCAVGFMPVQVLRVQQVHGLVRVALWVQDSSACLLALGRA